MQIRQLNDRLSVGPQIQPGDVAALKEAGFSTIINNRPDGEEPGQPTSGAIEDAVEAAGLTYHHIPVTRGPEHADVEAMGDALASADGKVFAFCRSGMRSCMTSAIARSEAGEEGDALIREAALAGYDISPVAHLL